MTRSGRNAPAPARSIYEEGCIAAHALDLLGDRWALLVIRELMLGPRRFSAIRAGLPGISASVLTQRLEGLEAGGVLSRVALADPAEVQGYELTARGLDAWPVLKALCLWGVQRPGHDPSKFISPSALMLSMRALGRRGGPLATAGFVLGTDCFAVTVGGGAYAVRRSGQPEGEVIFRGDANRMAALIYGPLPVAEAVAAGLGEIEGRVACAQEFTDRFSLMPG